MALPLSVSMLRNKRNDILDTIAMYEKRLEQARADLASVVTALRLFEVSDESANLPRYVDLNRVFKRGDILALCLAVLNEEGPLDTRQITERIMQRRGLDHRDKVLAQAISLRVVHTMRFRARGRGDVDGRARRRGVCLWTISRSECPR